MNLTEPFIKDRLRKAAKGTISAAENWPADLFQGTGCLLGSGKEHLQGCCGEQARHLSHRVTRTGSKRGLAMRALQGSPKRGLAW